MATRNAFETIRRRTLRVSLEQSDWADLRTLADKAGISAESLAAVWIVHQIGRESAVQSLRGSAAATESARAFSSAISEVARPSRAKISQRARRSAGALHDEILAVMAAREAPMTVAEIAAAIRERGRYRAPRTGRPITAELVSRRVANPRYKSLFKRAGRHLELAEPYARNDR